MMTAATVISCTKLISTVIFDLDDTLWDARPALVRAEAAQYAWIAEHAPRIAAAHTGEELRALRWELARRRPDIAHDFTRLRITALGELLAAFEYDAAMAVPAIEMFVRERSRVTLFPDAIPALADLVRDYTLVALTNGNADLAVAGVADYFSACISPAEAGVQKPDPRMFELALRTVDGDAARAVHVGDQPLYDIEGARRARLRTVWLNRAGVEWPAELAPAHAEIGTLTALRAVLLRLG